ncbi:glycoside hydrolase family 3 protein [Streptomyces sp. NBC_00683]|uniref:glycoside hydrolase family 3 protein n=1 Tax=Streptomyces sp. NBC_00683 TaxID=2903670 RepID=UPI002E34F111|nr:glycoside hydrolase family 3 protein [Streptomyces sp. NBC_00683]
MSVRGCGALRRSMVAATAAIGLLLGLPQGAAAGPGSAQDSRGGRDGGDKGRWVEGRLDAMTLEEKVGQLFVTYAYGETAEDTDADDVARNRTWLGVDNGLQAVKKYHLGGVIYFAWTDSFQNPGQVADLSDGLQRAALGSGAQVPLLISTDQEHGRVVRFGPPATQFPGSMALGASGRPKDAYKAGRISGTELRAVGINQDYAPVADVNVNPMNPVIGVRSFSSDPQLAADLTAAQVRGYQKAGTVATAKHFPGHGDTDVDSHTDLPVITHTEEEWERLDAPPFRAAIDAGVGSIMTAHLQFPSLDPSGTPATLSKPIMTGLLREEMGYDGVVVTDSLAMAGVRKTYPDAEVPVRALQAGVDMLLMPPNLDLAYRSVLAAVASGELTEDRIDTSVRRILTLKQKQGIADDPYTDRAAVDSVVGNARHLKEARTITDRTTTLIKNDGGLLPLTADGNRVLVTGSTATVTQTLAGAVTAQGGTGTALATAANPTTADIATAVTAAAGQDTVVVLTNSARTNPGQATLVQALTATGTPVVTISVGVPYDIASYPQAGVHLAAYSNNAIALESAARVLFGEVSPRGSLPVSIPRADAPGTALFPFGHGLTYTN